MLFVGVSVVQLQPDDRPVTQSPGEAIPTKSPPLRTQNPILGLAAVVASSICSGFAGSFIGKSEVVFLQSQRRKFAMTETSRSE